jgi:hypothetical protein
MCKKDGQGLSFIFAYASGELVKIVYGKKARKSKKYGNKLQTVFKKVQIIFDYINIDTSESLCHTNDTHDDTVNSLIDRFDVRQNTPTDFTGFPS